MVKRILIALVIVVNMYFWVVAASLHMDLRAKREAFWSQALAEVKKSDNAVAALGNLSQAPEAQRKLADLFWLERSRNWNLIIAALLSVTVGIVAFVSLRSSRTKDSSVMHLE